MKISPFPTVFCPLATTSPPSFAQPLGNLAPEPISSASRAPTSETRHVVRVLIAEPTEHVARVSTRCLQHERLEMQLVNASFVTWQQLGGWCAQFFVIGDDFADGLGLELVGQLRAKTNAPILLITATNSVGYLSNCLETGADDVLIRPVLPLMLLAKTQAMLRRVYRYSVPPVVSRGFSAAKYLGCARCARSRASLQ